MRLIVILCFLLHTYCCAQLKVIYNLSVQLTSQQKEYNNHYNTLISKAFDVLGDTHAVMDVCDDQSYFRILHNEQTRDNIVASSIIKSSHWISTNSQSLHLNPRNNVASKPDYNNDKWVISSNKKVIAGYECVMATKKLKTKDNPNKKEQLKVWFCPDISVLSGLMDATGLPGAILCYNDGTFEYTAIDVFVVETCEQLPVEKYKVMSSSNAVKQSKKRLQGMKY